MIRPAIKAAAVAALLALTLPLYGCGKPDNGQEDNKTVNTDPDPDDNTDPTPSTPEPEDPRSKPANDGTIRILAIGNSFSADAVEQELEPLFTAAGKKVIIGDMYIGGCDLQTHWAKVTGNLADYSYRKIVDGTLTKTASKTLEEGLKDEKWDYISFQEGAGHHGFYTWIHPYLDSLINYSRRTAAYKDFKVIYHVPWCSPKNSTQAKFGYYNYDQEKMYNDIVEVTKKVAGEMDFDVLINTFDAIQNGRTSYLGDNGFDRDGWHLNYGAGRYTAGCIWYEKLTGEDVTKTTYIPAGMLEQDAIVCRTAAHEACLHPYQTVDLSYFEKPQTPDPGTGPTPGQNPEEPVVDGKQVLAKWELTAEKAISDEYITSWTGLANSSSSIGVAVDDNQPGVRGYILANAGGNGNLTWNQIDKTSYSDKAGRQLVSSPHGCLPGVYGTLAGDYYLFETANPTPLPAGTKIHFEYSMYNGAYGAMYWMLEYLDGEEWKPAPGLEIKTANIDAKTKDTGEAFKETFEYNWAFPSQKYTWEPSFEITLEKENAQFKFRIKCCSEYQSNNVCFLHPRPQSEFRISGTVMPLIQRIIQ